MKLITHNPYIVGNPVKSRDMFFGREDDFKFVINKIGKGKSNQLLVFCGERRSGKTSILFQIMNGRLGEKILPILIDMQILAGIKNDLHFFRTILKYTCTALKLPGLKFENLEKISGESSIERLFEAFFNFIEENYPDKIILFLLDEYELIEAKIRDSSLSESSIHYLAGILESPHKVSFIFTGSTNLEHRKENFWRFLLGKSIYRKISYLSRNDTCRLITEPLKEYINYAEDFLASAYRLTGGQPFYIQVICQNIVDLLIEQQRNNPTLKDLNHIVKGIIDNPLPQMIYSWNSFSNWNRLILASLGGSLKNSESRDGVSGIYHFLKKNKIQIPFKKERINILLEDAYHKELLEKDEDDKYHYRIDLFRRWIKREHTIWKVIKECGLEVKKPLNPVKIGIITGASVILTGVIIWFFFPSSIIKNPDVSAELQDRSALRINEADKKVKNLKIVSNKQDTGAVFVYSDPPDAYIIIDGENTGLTTPNIVEKLSFGRHKIKLELEGFKSEILNIYVKSKDTIKKNVELTASYGFIILKIRPTAKVTFDSPQRIILGETLHPVETPHIKPLKIQAGMHILTIVNESLGVRKEIELDIVEGKTVTIEEELTNTKD